MQILLILLNTSTHLTLCCLSYFWFNEPLIPKITNLSYLENHVKFIFKLTLSQPLHVYLYYSSSKCVSTCWSSFESMTPILSYFLVKLTTSFYLSSSSIFSWFKTWIFAHSSSTPWCYLHICVCALVDACVYVSHVLVRFVHFGIYLYVSLHPWSIIVCGSYALSKL